MPIEGFEEVLAAAQRGDERALETIYRDLSPLVLGYLRSNGAREPDDLTSEVFVALVRNIPGFSGSRSRSGRGCSRSPTAASSTSSGIGPGGPRTRHGCPTRCRPGWPPTRHRRGRGPRRPRERAGQRCLSHLTDDQRAVITLRILADVPIKDVAAILGKPETAVKSLQHRALASLARRIDATPDELAAEDPLPSSIPNPRSSDH
jgi:RNA polymerase sigma-70 factor, ECF subfamily